MIAQRRFHAPLRRCGSAVAILLLASAFGPAIGQSDRETGLTQVDPRWHALQHARVVVRAKPWEVVEDATVVVRDGVIVSVRSGGEPPKGARIWDLSGHTIYPAFVETHLPVEVERAGEDDPRAHYYHQTITPQRSARSISGPSNEDRDALRNLGFAVAALAPDGGIVRGMSAVISLGDEGNELADEASRWISDRAYLAWSFATTRRFGGGGGDGDARRTRYPNSQMGAIALARQTFADAAWAAQCDDVYGANPQGSEPPEFHEALAVITDARRDGVPTLFDASDELQILRAAEVAKEFDLSLMILGCGTEFRRVDALRDAGLPIIVPLTFPDTPEVATPSQAEAVSLRELQTWEQAPTNPRRLVEAGVKTALTADKLDDTSNFYPHLHRAIEHGLSEPDALAMLTSVPASLLGLDDRLGAVAPGHLANLLVVDGELFVEKPTLRALWISGRRHELTAPDGPEADGTWAATVPAFATEEGDAVHFTVDGASLKVQRDEIEVKARNVSIDGTKVRFLVEGEELGEAGLYAFSGHLTPTSMRGDYFTPSGTRGVWSAGVAEIDPAPAGGEGDAATDAAADAGEASEDAEEEADAPATPPALPPEALSTPLGAYGLAEPAAMRDVLVTNATIWTCGPAGILEDGAMLVQNGRVAWVGPSAEAPDAGDADVIDAAGRHLTPGLIDCHSHTGVSGGVNEGGERVTAEVRIGDVINPDDINWYRQLAGGLTAANQLHGSANAIGGQNSVVKLRWGAATPRAMSVDGAKPGIKFALGENPKRVAQGTDLSDEYPQTRHGVETLIRDRLTAGRDYADAWDRYHALSAAEKARTMPPRRDLELEAMAEIVRNERLIHCHSYRQDEILMLCLVAKEFGFTIGTFQHVLEGYKVAEAIKEVALGGSTFSDWWAYKFEVVDAIPHNASIMTDVGVVVSINSDSSEHARRLNTEAAKGVKYGGMDPHEALKMVTLNPAIQLAVGDRMGSLEVGKDADFVLWSGSPLSYASRCTSTWIDGAEYYSLERDAAAREAANGERSRIIQKILADGGGDKKKGGGRRGRGFPGRPEQAGLLEQVWMERLRSGIDPMSGRPGDCGCTELLLGMGVR